MKILSKLLVLLALLTLGSLSARAGDTCVYLGGYPWRSGGCLIAPDLNDAVAQALQPPTTLATGAAAANLGSASGDVTGPWTSSQVVALQGHGLSNAVPTSGQQLVWNNATARWTPTTVPVLPSTSGTSLGMGFISTGSGPATGAFKPLYGSGTLWPQPGDFAFGPVSKAFVATAPDGTPIDCSLTGTNCALELMNAVLPKAGVDIFAGGGATGSLAVISFAGTFNVPMLRNAYVHFHGGGLFQVGTPAPGTPSIVLNSMVEGAFIAEAAQFAGATTTSAPGGTASGSMPIFLLDPTSTLPFEAFIGIGASRIDFGNATVQWTVGQSDSVIKATMLHGGITHNFIDALEINGGGPSPTTTGAIYAYLITGQVGGNSYFGNLHRWAYLHLTSLGGLQEGLNKTEGAFIVGNIYDIGGIETRGAGSIGADIWGQLGSRRYGVIANSGGVVDTCLALEAGASDNFDDVACYGNGASGAISTGINFKTDGVSPSKNNFAHLRAGGVNGVTTPVKDGGTNNIAFRGATAYTKDGLRVVSVSATGVLAGGTVIQGSLISVGTGAAQGGLVIGPTSDGHGNVANILQFGTAANVFIAGGGTTNGSTSDFSLTLATQTGGSFIFNNAGATLLALSVGTFDLTTGANSHLKLAQRGDDTTYNFASLNGVTTLSGGIGIMGGKTGDAQLYLVSAGTSIAFFVGGGLEGAVGGGWKVGNPTGGAEGGGTINVAGGIWNNGKLIISPTAPTISSGFGTSPSIVANNGPAAFTVNVGTGATAVSGVVGLPAAPNGWSCKVANITSQTANIFLTKQTATTTTTATFGNFTNASATAAWNASDILSISCFPY